MVFDTHRGTLTGVSLSSLLVVDEIVVRKSESCGLEIALFAVRIDSGLVGVPQVRPIARTVVDKGSCVLALPIIVNLVRVAVAHLKLWLAVLPIETLFLPR